jgi:hypothetical protein
MTIALVVSVLATNAAAQTQYKDPSGRFTFEYPKKDWQVFPGAGSSLVTVGGAKWRASIQIEYFSLNGPLKVSDNYDAIVSNESEFIYSHQPGAEQLKGLPMRPDLKDSIIVEYTRPGLSGRDRVRQYSMISGAHLFRISCVAPLSDFQKLEATFDQIAKSFAITADSKPTSK